MTMTEGPQQPERLLTVMEAADLLAVSRATMWRILKRGDLPSVTVGERAIRIRAEDLRQYIATHTKGAN